MKLSQKMLSLLHGEGPQPQSKFTYLSMVDIFQDLTTEELKEIERATATTTCAAGKMFYSPNQSGEVMFILKKGKVQIYRMSSEGRAIPPGWPFPPRTASACPGPRPSPPPGPSDLITRSFPLRSQETSNYPREPSSFRFSFVPNSPFEAAPPTGAANRQYVRLRSART